MKQLQKGVDDYTSAISYYTDNESLTTLYKGRAFVKDRAGDYKGAMEDFDKAISICKDTNELVWIYESRGMKAYNHGDKQGAYADFAKEILLKKNDYWAYQHRAEIYRQFEEYTKAIEDYTTAISLCTGDNCYSLYAGRAYAKSEANDLNGALDDCNKMISIKGDAYAYTTRAGVYADLKQYQKAIDDYTKGISLQNDARTISSYYTRKADAEVQLNRLKDAEEDLSKSIEASPTSEEKNNLYFGRGRFYYFTMKDIKLAKSDFEKVIQFDGDSGIDAAFAECFSGNKEKGYAIMNKLIAGSSEKWLAYFSMGRLRSLLGEEAEALKYVELSIKSGLRNVDYLQDDDLLNIKYKPAFKKLLLAYEIPYDRKIGSISGFIKGNVKTDLEKWQEKGEFETSQQYLERIKGRDEKIKDLTSKVLDKYKKEYIAGVNWKNYTIEKYDAESQTFKLTFSDLNESVILNVPLADAPGFKENQRGLLMTKQDYTIQNDEWTLSYVEVKNPATAKTYRFDITRQANYDPSNKFALNYDDFKIDLPSQKTSGSGATTTGNASKIYLGKADVDMNIPATATPKTSSYALIIGNEDYSSFQTDLNSEVNVDYAVNDAEVFKEYCAKTLGIPEQQIKYLKNATAAQIKQGLAWIGNLAMVKNGEAELVFYYSGHGLPDEHSKEPYLIPVDVNANNITDGIKLNDVYAKLSQYPSKRVSCFIDACFSGGARNVSLLAQKGIKIKPKETALGSNMLVLSSSTGDESSGVYRQKQHGYMTYFLLKKLQDSKGDISYKLLSDYVIQQVREATALSGKIQTPQIMTGADISNLAAIKFK